METPISCLIETAPNLRRPAAAGAALGDQVPVLGVGGGVVLGHQGPIYSHAVRIANPRPKIVSLPGGLDAEGVFRYAIEARDPDGDRSLRFQLSEGPPGMTVDPVTGEVLWRPTPEHAGVHAVELVVKDSEGASASQTFELTVTSETDPAPAAIP